MIVIRRRAAAPIKLPGIPLCARVCIQGKEYGILDCIMLPGTPRAVYIVHTDSGRRYCTRAELSIAKVPTPGIRRRS